MENKFLLYFKHKDMNYVINGKESFFLFGDSPHEDTND